MWENIQFKTMMYHKKERQCLRQNTRIISYFLHYFFFFAFCFFSFQFKFYSSIDTFDITMRIFVSLFCAKQTWTVHSHILFFYITTAQQLHNFYLYCMKIIHSFFHRKYVKHWRPKKKQKKSPCFNFFSL